MHQQPKALGITVTQVLFYSRSLHPPFCCVAVVGLMQAFPCTDCPAHCPKESKTASSRATEQAHMTELWRVVASLQRKSRKN